MAAHFGDLAIRVKFAAEEGTGLEVEFGISCLLTVSLVPVLNLMRRTNIDIFKDGHNKYVQYRIAPSYHDSRAIGLANVRRPEHSHQPIMLYHDQQLCRPELYD